jgi:hypothetical protein
MMEHHRDFWRRPVTDRLAVQLAPGDRPRLLIRDNGQSVLELELLETRALVEVLNVAVGELFILQRDPAALMRVQQLLAEDVTLADNGDDGRFPCGKPRVSGHVQAQELLRRYRGGERGFANADLRYADLQGADLRHVDLRRANLAGANLKRANLFQADLEEANLSEANLEETGFFQANLAGADLSKANLRRAYLNRATLIGAQLADEQLAQAQALEGATMPDGTTHG